MRIDHPERAHGQTIVVVVGAGFGGLHVAKRLANTPRVQVILVDQRNHHLFQPLLYQVATAALNPSDIAVPIRAQFTHARNVEVHLGRVDGVDLGAQVVRAGGHEVGYDYLVLACGATHSYFNHPEWEPFAPGLKTIEQATEIRRRILTAFELAENELDPAALDARLTFVVVGGGPTGVELAGAIAEISRTVLRGNFRRIDPSRARVVLVEAGLHLLASFSGPLSQRATRDLIELGVEVRTGAMVSAIDAEGVTIGNERLLASSVFWAAGVRAAHLDLQPSVATDRNGRLRVAPDLSLPDWPHVFAIGDMASLELESGRPLPGIAPAAIQGGQHVAATIRRDLDGLPRVPFAYSDRGQMATIGKSRAIAQTPRLTMTGRPAWIAWLLVHLFSLIGFRNRISVVWRWGWSYLFSRRDARLITDRDWMLRR